MPMKYEVVLFDADGTLFDFARAEAFALENAFREVSLPYLPEYLEDYKVINHATWRQFERGEVSSLELRTLRFERFCSKIGIDTNPESMSTRYLSWLAQARFLIDGAERVVGMLSDRCRLAIVTNGLKDVQNGRFGRSPIRRYFDAIVISEEIGIQKPDPAIFVHALELLGHNDKTTVLMVGDSLTSDIQGGVNFGIDTCWFNPDGNTALKSPVPNHVVRRLDELIELCIPVQEGEGR